MEIRWQRTKLWFLEVPFKLLSKRGRGQSHMTLNFWALNANCSTVVKSRAYGLHICQAIPWDEKLLRGQVRTVPGNMLAKFEVRIFECVGSGLDSDHQLHCKIDGPKFADPRLFWPPGRAWSRRTGTTESASSTWPRLSYRSEYVISLYW